MLSPSTLGVLAGSGAFAFWGTLLLYWYALEHVSALEILAHRIAWSLVFISPLAFFTHRLPEARAALRDKGTMLRIFSGALLIASNWGMYIYAVTSGRVLEASLGYYINPLVNVFLGFVLLRERMSRLQTFAVMLAGAGVVFSVVSSGRVPWLALALAGTFALYGFIRKTVRVESVPALLIETALLTPLALMWLVWIHSRGELAFNPAQDPQSSLFLAGAGIVTAVPLLLFSYAARHISLISLGILQYISPSITLILGIFVVHAETEPSTFVTFAFIWTALVLYTWCGLRRLKGERK